MKFQGGVIIHVYEESKDRLPEYFNICNSACGGGEGVRVNQKGKRGFAMLQREKMLLQAMGDLGWSGHWPLPRLGLDSRERLRSAQPLR